jgi:hypothetical protein
MTDTQYLKRIFIRIGLFAIITAIAVMVAAEGLRSIAG